jgi:enoyl-CoA hydratase/carnithine racemase
MRYLLTGELLDAREAYRIGLVQEVVPVDGLKDRAMALASVIAANAPLGVRDTLEVGRIVHDRGLQAGLDEISPRRDQILRSQDAHEGLVSFTERRPANYVGK